MRDGAKAFIVDEDTKKILMVRERRADNSRFWTLPGGGVHHTESVEQAIQRECMEEIGATVLVGDHIGDWTYDHKTMEQKSRYRVHFTDLHGEPEPMDVEGLAWRETLPPRTLGTLERWLRDEFVWIERRESETGSL